MLVYPSGMTLSTRHLRYAADALRAHRRARGTRWRILPVERQALMVLAHLRKGETYQDLALGFGVGVSTAYRYLREGLQVLAALASTLQEAIHACARKAYITLDGTLIRIDRVAMASKRDRPFFSGKHKAHGVNVQVIADPAGRLIWASPPLPGARHDAGAAGEHGLPAALAGAGVTAFADTAYIGLGRHIRAPFRRDRRDRRDRATRKVHPPRTLGRAAGGEPVDLGTARAGRAGNAELKNWRILRRIRSSPAHADRLVDAVQALIINA